MMTYKLLHDLLTDSAARYPDKVAVSYKDERLSYRSLDELSSRLSSFCIGKGIETGGRTGIYLDKSIASVIAIFGILKSGACYVPLDPLAPVERQILIVNDCALEYLITSSSKLPQVRKICEHARGLKNIFVMDIDREEYEGDLGGMNVFFKDEVYAEDSMRQASSVTVNNFAYILYTSGSTGQPKGVMLSHRAAYAFVDQSIKTFKIGSDDIVSSHAPFHFDLSVFDIFVSITGGATICLVPQGLSSFPKSVVDFIERNKITTWYSVPSILIQLLLHGDLEKKKMPSLRQILFAGEVFPSQYLRKLMELIPHPAYYNLYGMTETNNTTYYHVTEPPDPKKTIPIGVLFDGVRSYILNESGSLVKEGEMGELYVSCPTLMDGYWNDTKRTENVLIKNLFDPSSADMIYKTGDIVHWNDNGEIEYHGRCDALIKSRGYRIEVGEIETVLSSHPGLKESAVTAVPDDEIGSKIKAVIAPKNKGAVSENDIKLFCSKKLPHYMIPEILSIVDALPRTSTGKIDRKNLARDNT